MSMNISDVHLIHRKAEPETTAPPILFIHGAFAGAWCWDEYFLPWFANAGFDAYAIDLPGRRNRSDYARLQDYTISDYQDAVFAVIDSFDQPPIVVGHSMGGFLGWRAAEEKDIAALVMMAPVPPTGLAAPAMQLAVTNPALAMDVASVHAGDIASVDTLHQTMFSKSVPKDVAAQYISRFQGESQLAVAGLYNPRMPNIMGVWGTLIKIVGGDSDTLIPAAHVHWTGSICGRSAYIYENMGHGMMLETDWLRVAEDISEWLDDQGLRVSD